MSTRQTELTDSAIDWATNAEELWEFCQEDADALADMAIDATLDALGQDDETEEDFDRDRLIEAINAAYE